MAHARTRTASMVERKIRPDFRRAHRGGAGIFVGRPAGATKKKSSFRFSSPEPAPSGDEKKNVVRFFVAAMPVSEWLRVPYQYWTQDNHRASGITHASNQIITRLIVFLRSTERALPSGRARVCRRPKHWRTTQHATSAARKIRLIFRLCEFAGPDF